MPTVHDIERAIFAAAPKELAMQWDNVGHLVGNPGQEVHRVLVALDITPWVVEEAVATHADLIVAHHPVMNVHWHSDQMQTLRDDTRLGSILLTMIRNNISAICMHTNLDIASGGINDILAEMLGLEDIRPLGDDGVGRVGALPEELSVEEFLALLKDRLHPNGIRYTPGKPSIKTVGVGGGACGDYLCQAAQQGCDAFVTADLKYNQFLDDRPPDLTLIDAGHFPTEDVMCLPMVEYLQEQFPGLEAEKSYSHREVIQYYV